MRLSCSSGSSARGVAGAGRRTGRRGQPAQRPADVVGLPSRLRVLLPVGARTGRRPCGRAAEGLDPELVSVFAADYQEFADQQEWFGQILDLAARHGFAPNAKEYKKNSDAYPGSIREASQMIPVALTGSIRSPDLVAVARALGTAEVLRRVRALNRVQETAGP